MQVNTAAPAPGALERAAGVLRAGGLVIYPTDTFYGLAADPRLAAAVVRVFAAKGRAAGQALPLVAATVEQARQVAALSETGERLARRFWPGPLTLVADVQAGLAEGVTGDAGSIAVRVPDHGVARGLAEALGFAITSTSANRSGTEAPRTADEASRALEGLVDLVLDAGPTLGGRPSTIIDPRGVPPRLLRAGAVPFDLILDFIARP